MQAYLKKHGPGHASHSLKVEWEVQGDEISLQFRVQKRLNRPWLSDEIFTHDWAKNWGLWNKDVVEAFLQLRSHPDDIKAPYLEIQVSPLNQPFALIITEPRKVFAAPKALEFSHEVSVENRIWNTTMKLTLPPELSGNHLYGGFFACLDQDPREYYALEPNQEVAPDFHRPDLFLPLMNHE
jgi:hypothetical protein